MNNKTDLSNLHCVVAGSQGLLGKSLCMYLTEHGARVFEIDINDSGKSKDFFKADVGSVAELEKVFSQLPANAQGVEWGFVNLSYPRTKNWAELSFDTCSLEDFNENVRLHLGSAFLFSKLSVEFLKRVGGGSLVNLSSIYGVLGPDLKIYEGTPMINPVPYAAIKAGIIGLTRYIASTHGKDKIRANVVGPGGVFDSQPEPFVKAYNSKTPLNRMALPEEISSSIAFLLSPASSYISGQVLMVDGGYTSW